ncbi:hypothetical protein DSECCO2_570020 [anaerobic digester metagenome]
MLAAEYRYLILNVTNQADPAFVVQPFFVEGEHHQGGVGFLVDDQTIVKRKIKN